MSEPVGKQLPRAKPVTLTFYDTLQTQPYTTTFYVRDETPDEVCHRLIEAVASLSMCVLGKYQIGHHKYVVPEYQKGFETISGSVVMGTFKWQISYHTPNGSVRRHTIPGRNPEHGIRGEKTPNPNHPLWQEFLDIFRASCVSKEGEPIQGPLELGYTSSNWPPKSAKKRGRRKRKV